MKPKNRTFFILSSEDTSNANHTAFDDICQLFALSSKPSIMMHVAVVNSLGNMLRSRGLYFVSLLGGLVFVAWLFATPAGILGKSDAIGFAVCHRIDLRSFHIGFTQLPLCARCTGQYLGAMTGLIFLALVGRRRIGMPPRYIICISILLAAFYVVDGINSYFYLPPLLRLFPWMPHLYQPSNALRLFTGTGLGLVIALLIYPTFISTIFTDSDKRPIISNFTDFTALIIFSVLADVLVLIGSGYVLFPVALLSALTVLVLLTMVYTIIWIRILSKENQYQKISQLWLPLTAGFSLAILQIALFDTFRFIITGTWNGLVFN